MYIPKPFAVTDRTEVCSFVRKHSFGLLITTHGLEIEETHTPLVLSDDEQFLWGHLARANRQWENWGDATIAKAVFRGPHAYVSPRYYYSDFNVPTWNYCAVSVSGALEIIEEELAVLSFLDRLVRGNERTENGWQLDRSDNRYLQLLDGIVVFKLRIRKVEASFKLNQNKSREDRESVITHLRRSAHASENSIANLMEESLGR